MCVARFAAAVCTNPCDDHFAVCSSTSWLVARLAQGVTSNSEIMSRFFFLMASILYLHRGEFRILQWRIGGVGGLLKQPHSWESA